MDVLPSPPDEFDAWPVAPPAEPCPDPRFEIRRALPEDFPRIYETVDAAFGTRRPRSLFDWMYLQNPNGRARFWIMTERSSGRVVRSATCKRPLYWCPHNATFLNWRYLDHPTEPYVAFAAVEADEPVAYAVARIDAEEASIVEFVADPNAKTVQRALLSRILERARAAGSGWLRFEASPRFRHWRFFTRAGFFPTRSANYVDLYAMEAPAEAATSGTGSLCRAIATTAEGRGSAREPDMLMTRLRHPEPACQRP